MSVVRDVADMMVRQAVDAVSATSTSAAAAATSSSVAPPACVPDNDYDGRLGLRISAIFIILIGSVFGAVFPVFAARHRGIGVPEWVFFIAKYFGSGVIIATAFIHLLSPANDALRNPCLSGIITEYDWVEGIALMTIFAIFFTELMAMRYATFGHTHAHSHADEESFTKRSDPPRPRNPSTHTPGEDHLSHSRTHVDNEEHSSIKNDLTPPTNPQEVVTIDLLPSDKPTPHEVEDYAAQMTAIFILEFGVIFHSIFVGLTLAVAGAEFDTLYVVLVFHQTFEGLGLGSRLAATPWPKEKRSTPYLLALGFALSTPVALAVGLGVRKSYAPGSQTSLIVNGVFDSISAGILIYTGLVELMAHEFMFSAVMRRARLRVVMSAFVMMCLGAGLMALLGKWA